MPELRIDSDLVILHPRLWQLGCCLIGLTLCLASDTPADEKLAGRACRSVHVQYSGSEAIAFFNEITVEHSAPGTYFCVCGWNKGYFGIQELGNNKKVIIFSVWDSNQNDPKSVAEDRRVKLLHQGKGVRIGRFGGEGTGGQSFLDLDWKIGETYRFLVAAKVNGNRTEYAGYFQALTDKEWRHLVTFSTITGGKKLGGYYAFVEDFKRDRASLTKARSAKFGNPWIKTDQEWKPIMTARFTADSNPATNINSGVADGAFFLATGGQTQNSNTKLNGSMTLPADANRKAPSW